MGLQFPGHFTRMWTEVMIVMKQWALKSEEVTSCLKTNGSTWAPVLALSAGLLTQASWPLNSLPFLLYILFTVVYLTQMFFDQVLNIWMTFQLRQKRKSLLRRNICVCLERKVTWELGSEGIRHSEDHADAVWPAESVRAWHGRIFFAGAVSCLRCRRLCGFWCADRRSAVQSGRGRLRQQPPPGTKWCTSTIRVLRRTSQSC